MWDAAVASDAFQAAITGAREIDRGIVRIYGIPEAELAATLVSAQESGVELDALEVTTCLRRGEIEIATRFEPAAQARYDALLGFLREHYGTKIFSEDGSTIDDELARLMSSGPAAGTLAVAESCTAGAARGAPHRTARRLGLLPRRRRRLLQRAKTLVAGVPAELIESVGRSRSRWRRRSPRGSRPGSAPPTGSDHRDRGTGRRDRGEAGRARVRVGMERRGRPTAHAGAADARQPSGHPRPLGDGRAASPAALLLGDADSAPRPHSRSERALGPIVTVSTPNRDRRVLLGDRRRAYGARGDPGERVFDVVSVRPRLTVTGPRAMTEERA